MNPTEKQKLLRNRKVVEEVSRHQWIESEKAGHDIGFDKAAADWLERFSTAWLQYHMPSKKTSAKRLFNKIFPNRFEK